MPLANGTVERGMGDHGKPRETKGVWKRKEEFEIGREIGAEEAMGLGMT